ncbi:MAG: hypothetical protein ACXACR_04875 [Candidatus Hodarchaeales archaeon]|jgi:anaerobic ribonucleoside-triphosphate reductase
MAFKCKKCKSITEGLHVPSKCENCGNRDTSKFDRVPDKISPEKKKKLKEELENLHRT